jgi:hypothetical protein
MFVAMTSHLKCFFAVGFHSGIEMAVAHTTISRARAIFFIAFSTAEARTQYQCLGWLRTPFAVPAFRSTRIGRIAA